MSMTSELTPSTTRPESSVERLLAGFTVADGLMVGIGLLAAWLRLGDLARLPLSAAEATAALPSYHFWSAGAAVLPPVSPAYCTFTNLIMGLGGNGDAAARLVPALFGVLTVLLLWAWRKRAHPAAWLVPALFMALSPLLTAVSRTAGGDAIALFALLLIVAAGWGDEMGRGRAIALGIGVGLGLTSSPLFYTGLAGLLPAVWVAGAGRPSLSGRAFRTAALAAALTFLLVASFGLFYTPGIGASLRLFPAWLGQFGLQADPESATMPLFSPWLTLLRYEPAIFVLGVPAAVWAFLRRDRHGLAMVIWLIGALLIALLQPDTPANLTAALPAGYLLVGLFGAMLAAAREHHPIDERRMFWSTAIGLMGLGALVLAAFGRFARLDLLTGENANLILLSALAFVMAGLAVILAMGWESAAARRGAFVGLAALLLFWQWGTAMQLSRLGANDPRERWVIGATDDDVQLMADVVRSASWQLANSGRDLRIFSMVESPALDWYMRDYVGYQSGAAVPLELRADVVITPLGAELALPDDYFGTDFALTQHKIPDAGPATLSDRLKWLLFRDSTAPTETERVVLWVRSDLAR